MKQRNYEDVCNALTAMSALQYLSEMEGAEDWRLSIESAEERFTDSRDLELENKIQEAVNKWINKHPHAKTGHVIIAELHLTVEVFIYHGMVTYHNMMDMHTK